MLNWNELRELFTREIAFCEQVFLGESGLIRLAERAEDGQENVAGGGPGRNGVA